MSRMLVRNFSMSLDGYGAGLSRISKIHSGLGPPRSTNGSSPPAAAFE
jgi:hypothetical protein